LLVVVAAAACTLPARTTSLEREQQRLRETVTTLETRVQVLEGRLATLGKRVIGNAKKPGKDAVEAIETRVPDATPTPRAATPTPAPKAAPELDVDGLRRESARQLPAGYRRGVDLVRAGRYEEAIRVLRDFVRAEHASPSVAGAHYWIGQAHMQLGQFYQAILAFTDVQQRAPRSALAAAAGLASGTAFRELGNVSEARRAFERVVAEHPNAPEAAKAAARLRALDRLAP
jgi:tol-pal system protein YbgF